MPQPSARRADTFQLADVADAYRARPPYPDEIVDRLVALAGAGRVLDLGAGDGSLTRPLAGRVAAVDAVERSAAMIEVGRSSPGGDLVSWHREAAETFTASEPFDVAVVGEAMHWFDLPVVVARLREVLRLGAPLALVDRSTHHPGLAEVVEVIKRFSRADDHDPSYDVADDLTVRGLWRQVGELVPPTRSFRQSPEDYLASLRSTSSLARALMTESDNAAFDEAVLGIMWPLADDEGMITLDVTARLVWGLIR